MKHVLITTIVCISGMSAHARPGSEILIEGGVSAATLDHQYRESRYGASGGLAGVLWWPVAERFVLAGQLDLLYTPRGADVVVDGEYIGGLRQRYVDILLSARPSLRIGHVSGYLIVGAGVSRLMSATSENASGASQDGTDGLRRTDVSLIAGAGGAFHLPHAGASGLRLDRAFLEVRHDHGFIDIDKMDGGFKNRTTSIMLGLSLAFGADAKASP